MGLLSKKRKVPRIVKKVKTHIGRKNVSIRQLDPRIRKHWDAKMSVQENFQNIGLRLDLNPSFKNSKEGRQTMEKAAALFFEKRDAQGKKEEEEEEDEEFVDIS